MMIQSEIEADYTVRNAWDLSVGSEICSDVQKGLDHEWFVTNGLGGYAASSVVGGTTRSYHSLLVAALRPPVERDVLITKIDETVERADNTVLKLGVNEYRDGTIATTSPKSSQTVLLAESAKSRLSTLTRAQWLSLDAPMPWWSPDRFILQASLASSCGCSYTSIT
jgi:glycogen debranching enzyme-like protein